MNQDIIIGCEGDRARALYFIESVPIDPPHQIIIREVVPTRTAAQNRLQRKWMNEASAQLQDGTPEEKRGYCKLHFGVPILRAASEEYCRLYDEIIRPLPYHKKLLMMMAPLDYPVTRGMTVKQKGQYLDEVYNFFTSIGVQLTRPEG